MKNKWNEIP